MGGLNVKITMIERVLQTIAPHPCSGCTKIGTILCPDCKYDIIHEPFMGCILCGCPQVDGICPVHASPVQRAFTISDRTGTLQHVINRLKFSNSRHASKPLAELLDATLPMLPRDIVIVPIPTVTTHIRQRGYDHVELIARRLASLRKMPMQRVLIRKSKATQHTVDRKARKEQAACAFLLNATASVQGKTVLLFDDIVTTGSTLSAAAQLLHGAGATVWVATLAYQPLD